MKTLKTLNALDNVIAFRFGGEIGEALKNNLAVVTEREDVQYLDVKLLNDEVAEQRQKIRKMIKGYRSWMSKAQASGDDMVRAMNVHKNRAKLENIALEVKLYRRMIHEAGILMKIYLKKLETVAYRWKTVEMAAA